MNKDLKFNKKLFLQIILHWLFPTATLVRYIGTWEIIRKHFRFTKNHLKFDKRLFLQIILIWLLPTTTSVSFMRTWKSTRKQFPFTKNHLKLSKKFYLQTILRWLLPTTTSVSCITTWESTQKHSQILNVHLPSDNVYYLPITLTLEMCERILKVWKRNYKEQCLINKMECFDTLGIVLFLFLLASAYKKLATINLIEWSNWRYSVLYWSNNSLKYLTKNSLKLFYWSYEKRELHQTTVRIVQKLFIDFL
jgi:hypothetical protein